VSVTVNGQDAGVLYAGIAPGLVEGVNQINVKLPVGISTGTVSVVLRVGTAGSTPFTFGL